MTPIVITAPGLFSTTTFQPSPSDSAVAMIRARISGGVLADAGTTIRMTFEGKDCPSAGLKAAAPRLIAAAPVKNARLSMAFLWFVARPIATLRLVFEVLQASEAEQKLAQGFHYRIGIRIRTSS